MFTMVRMSSHRDHTVAVTVPGAGWRGGDLENVVAEFPRNVNVVGAIDGNAQRGVETIRPIARAVDDLGNGAAGSDLEDF
jgi:adenosine/AMP kinase